jgi:hypothetical protein
MTNSLHYRFSSHPQTETSPGFNVGNIKGAGLFLLCFYLYRYIIDRTITLQPFPLSSGVNSKDERSGAR